MLLELADKVSFHINISLKKKQQKTPEHKNLPPCFELIRANYVNVIYWFIQCGDHIF